MNELERYLSGIIRKYGKDSLEVIAKHFYKSNTNWVLSRLEEMKRFRECPFCDKFMELYNLQKHIKNKHRNENLSLNKAIKLIKNNGD